MRSLFQFSNKIRWKYWRELSTTRGGGISGLEPVKRVCIVGGGAAGFYAAQYIVKHLPHSRVDIIEKLPVPFGLVRFGVAPDHQEVKNVINTFSKTAENPNVRFLGNLSLGSDLKLQNLRQQYHAIILAYGAEKDQKLNIPNENQPNIISAREFVAWYNGLPGTEHLQPDLSGRSVAIIGQGNVAIDVSRILLSPIDILSRTDITAHSLDILSRSKVEKVHFIGRRGPLQAAFTIKELREMTKLPSVQIKWRTDDFHGVAEQIPNLPRAKKRITELMVNSLKQTTSNGLQQNEQDKTFLPIFFRSPKQFVNGQDLQLTVNQLNGSNAIPTDQMETLNVNLVLRSIGYKGINVDDDINFDDRKGVVLNENGRVLKKTIDENGKYERGLYVSGWLATGPTGVIITTMNNAFTVADLVCQDFLSGTIDSSQSMPGIDLNEFPNVVTWNGWRKIDQNEIEAGKSIKPREKIINIKKMLEIAL